jgi:hypothetical protein
MNAGVAVLLAFAMALGMFMLVQKLTASPFVITDTPNIPATWNLDWQGGPGFDRFKILNERGPYNM